MQAKSIFQCVRNVVLMPHTVQASNKIHLKKFVQRVSSGCRNFQTTSVTPIAVANQQVMATRRVLSIQSHVVHGYVGNKSATFPLQLLGFEVDAINSVQFSNHTGYKSFKGQVLDEKQLEDVFQGLVDNELISKYSHLLTGYIGNEHFLRQIASIVKRLREANPNLIYVCDPVMGDDGFIYVPKELLPIYRDEIVPLANITTPNQYEAELITGEKIVKEADVWKACDWFHSRGVATVVLSSTDLGGDNKLIAFLSHNDGSAAPQKYKLTIPKQAEGIRFTGTGDLFASMFLANSYDCPDFGKALERTNASLQAIIKRTVEHIPKAALARERKALAWERELKLIQSKADIESPKVELFAVKVAQNTA